MGRVLKYNEAYLKITQLVQELALKPGDKLPTENEIARLLGMSIAPVRQALAALQEHDVVDRRPGVGTFYCGSMKTGECTSLLGVVNVGDRFFPNGREAFELRNALARHHASCRIFSVPLEVDTTIIDELRKCDRFLVTGFVNAAWMKCLQSLNAPIVQLGCSEPPLPLCRVEVDWADGMRQAVETMLDKGCRRIVLLAPDPKFNSHAIRMRDTFLGALRQCGLEADLSMAPLIPYERAFAAIREVICGPEGMPDALLTIEPGGNIFSLLLAMLLERPADLPYLVIFQNINQLSVDSERFMPKLYHVLNRESELEAAIKVLYDSPYSFIEERKIYRTRQEIGCGRERLPVPEPMPEITESTVLP